MNYTIADYDLDQITHNMFGIIPVKVKGYWSSEAIYIYCSGNSIIDQNDEKVVNWKVEVNHSTGGRDLNEVEDDLEATQYFAQALSAAADLAARVRHTLTNQ